uniref:Uncharacterized protein n=1 Tax=Setaria digitata TaxID=48799 RepID=A0A915Q721_9BILA
MLDFKAVRRDLICKSLEVYRENSSGPLESVKFHWDSEKNKRLLSMLSLAMNEYNKISDDDYDWIPTEILDIRSIRNTGMHYSIKVAMTLSNCTKTSCTFEMFQPSWKVPGKIRLVTCSDYISPEQLTEKSRPLLDKSFTSNMKPVESIAGLHHWLEPKMLMSWNSFSNFVKKFKRTYSSIEEQLNRFKIYIQNMRFAKKLQHEEKGTAIYGETQFSDMTREEFKKIMLPKFWERNVKLSGVDFDLKDFNLSLEDLPKSFDWGEKGAVTPVKNQGYCGSCWAFSVTGNIEGVWAIKTGQLVSLSEQELVDCDVIDQGCNGGLPVNAFQEIIRMGGLEPEDRYPYKAKNGTCHLVRADIAVTIDDFVRIPNNETVMKAWVAQRGPLSVGIDAELLAYYKGGILHPSRARCPSSKIDHGVLITGYGVHNSMPYWIIKNSWGPQWGENGYFRLMRGKDVCGVSEMASSAIIY